MPPPRGLLRPDTREAILESDGEISFIPEHGAGADLPADARSPMRAL